MMPPRVSPLSAATFSAVLVLLTACGTNTPAADPPASPISIPSPEGTARQSAGSATAEPVVPGDGSFPSPGDADRTSADSTAELAARIMHSWDTKLDLTETAAAIRAKPLMSPEWAANQVEPQRNANQAAWLKPSAHSAYSIPRVTKATGDVARDVADDKAIRSYDVTWNWVSRDGVKLTETGSSQVTLYLEKHSGQWQVVGHQVRDMPKSETGGGQ